MKRFGVIAVIAAAALAQGALAAPPRQPPPGTANAGPPAAWLEDGARSVWLAYAAFCWDSNCVRMRSPASRSDIPRMRGLRNRTVRLHFGFDARQITVGALNDKTHSAQSLRPGRLVLWRVRQSGIVLINVNAPGRGTVSYAVNLSS